MHHFHMKKCEVAMSGNFQVSQVCFSAFQKRTKENQQHTAENHPHSTKKKTNVRPRLRATQWSAGPLSDQQKFPPELIAFT